MSAQERGRSSEMQRLLDVLSKHTGLSEYESAELIDRALARAIPPAEGTPQNPVDGATHPCPEPGYAGRHAAVGAGAVSPPYVCHGCRTWFVLPEQTRVTPPAEGGA